MPNGVSSSTNASNFSKETETNGLKKVQISSINGINGHNGNGMHCNSNEIDENNKLALLNKNGNDFFYFTFQSEILARAIHKFLFQFSR